MPVVNMSMMAFYASDGYYHHHHHVTQSSHSINAIGPAPLWSDGYYQQLATRGSTLKKSRAAGKAGIPAEQGSIRVGPNSCTQTQELMAHPGGAHWHIVSWMRCQQSKQQSLCGHLHVWNPTALNFISIVW
jgi:hypothetical protein